MDGRAGAHLDRAAEQRRVAARAAPPRRSARRPRSRRPPPRPTPSWAGAADATQCGAARYQASTPCASHQAPIARTLSSDCATASAPRPAPVALGQRRAVQRQRGDEAAVAPARPDARSARPPARRPRRPPRPGARRPTGPCSRRRSRRRRRCVSPGERRERGGGPASAIHQPWASWCIAARTLPSQPMRAVVITGKGAPDVLQVQERPDPQAQAGPGGDRRPRRRRQLRRPDGARRPVPGRAAAAGGGRLRGRRRRSRRAARASTASRSATA